MFWKGLQFYLNFSQRTVRARHGLPLNSTSYFGVYSFGPYYHVKDGNLNQNPAGIRQTNSHFFEQWAVKNDHNDGKNDHNDTAEIIKRAMHYAYGYKKQILDFVFVCLNALFGWYNEVVKKVVFKIKTSKINAKLTLIMTNLFCAARIIPLLWAIFAMTESVDFIHVLC